MLLETGAAQLQKMTLDGVTRKGFLVLIFLGAGLCGLHFLDCAQEVA